MALVLVLVLLDGDGRFYIIGDTIELRSLILSSVILNIPLLLYLLVVKLAIMHRAPTFLIYLRKYTIWNHPVLLLGIPYEAVHLGIRIYPWPRDNCVISFLVYPPKNRGYHFICLFSFFIPTWLPAWYLIHTILLEWFPIHCVPLYYSLCIFHLWVYISPLVFQFTK